MKTKIYRQGDVLLIEACYVLAAGNKRQPQNGRIVLVEGEATGHREYWLRVPPNVTTAKQAVAWTFGLEAERYAPVAEA